MFILNILNINSNYVSHIWRDGYNVNSVKEETETVVGADSEKWDEIKFSLIKAILNHEWYSFYELLRKVPVI